MEDLELVYTKPKMKFPVLSWLIRLFTWFGSSHVVVRRKSTGWCFHVYFNLWTETTTEELLKSHDIVYVQSVQVPSACMDSLQEVARGYNGHVTKGYYLYLIGSLLGNWFHVINPVKALYDEQDSPESCSEMACVLLVRTLIEAGHKGFEFWPKSLPLWRVSNITPKGLFVWFKENVSNKVERCL